jgi:hypothetical protein
LYQYLRESGEDRLAEIVRKDVKDTRERRYLFAGFGPEVSSRWISQYGRISVGLYKALMVQYPTSYLRTVKKLWIKYFYRGAAFPQKAMTQLRTLTSPIPAERVFYIITYVFKVFAHGAYAGMFIYGAALLGYVFIRARDFSDIYDKVLSMPAFMLLSIPIIMLSFIHSTIVGGENDRYFMQNTPYLVLIPGYILSRLRLSIIDRRAGRKTVGHDGHETCTVDIPQKGLL